MNGRQSMRWGTLALGVGIVAACGSEENEGSASGDGGTGSGTVTRSYELVQTTDPDIPITQPLEVFVYDRDTGMELDPPVRATARAGTGTFELTYPADVVPAIYVVGNSDEQDAPYDAITLNQPGSVFDPRLRMSSLFTAQLVFDAAQIEPRQNAAALGGTVYWSPDGERRGVVGCAQILLDGDESGFDEASDQRYVGENGLPVPASSQDRTHPVQGSFYFGNLDRGPHRMRAVLDGGATVLGEIDVPIAYAREDAVGPSGMVFYTTAFDLDVPENPTPAGCTVE